MPLRTLRVIAFGGSFFSKKILFLSACLLSATLGWVGCGGADDDDQPPVPDVSGISVQVQIDRFEREVFGLDTLRIGEGMARLRSRYPVVFPYFMQNMVADPNHPEVPDSVYLGGFLRATQVRRLYDTCQTQFADLQPVAKQFADLFRYYKHYFPEKKEPRVATVVSEMVGDAVMADDTSLLLGIDFFLGKNFVGYDPNIFPQYLIKQFDRQYIPIKVALALADRAVPPPATDHMLDYMIRNGKIYYLAECLLPNTPDSLLINYTATEWSGSIANEQRVWSRLLDLDVLYQPRNGKNIKLITPGPNTPLVFDEAPGEIGSWVGWRIVRAYMRRHPNTSMTELLAQQNAQQFLEKSKYKPKREE